MYVHALLTPRHPSCRDAKNHGACLGAFWVFGASLASAAVDVACQQSYWDRGDAMAWHLITCELNDGMGGYI